MNDTANPKKETVKPIPVDVIIISIPNNIIVIPNKTIFI